VALAPPAQVDGSCNTWPLPSLCSHPAQVDGFMATSAPGVYAVGDVAAFPLKMAGNKMVRPCWARQGCGGGWRGLARLPR